MWVFLLYLFTNYDPWYPKYLIKMISFYSEIVSGFLGLCQAKWNEISRTNPDNRSWVFIYVFICIYSYSNPKAFWIYLCFSLNLWNLHNITIYSSYHLHNVYFSRSKALFIEKQLAVGRNKLWKSRISFQKKNFQNI